MEISIETYAPHFFGNNKIFQGSVNKWVILYRIELILYFEPWQLDALEAMRHCLNKKQVC